MQLFRREDPLWSLNRIVVSFTSRARAEGDLSATLSSATLDLLSQGRRNVDHFIFSTVPPYASDTELRKAGALVSSSRTHRAALAEIDPLPTELLDCLSPFGWMLESGECGVLLHTEAVPKSGPTATSARAFSFGITTASGSGALNVTGIWKLHGVSDARPWVLKALAGDLVASGRLPKNDHIIASWPKAAPRYPLSVSSFGAMSLALLDYCENDLQVGSDILLVGPSGYDSVVFMSIGVWRDPEIETVWI